ncbi:hypothetical protein FRB90_009266 [Tulasnella sp. 427]|nr:hypothetical protein FRB90_009266 [Tulasnella sp. 427]
MADAPEEGHKQVPKFRGNDFAECEAFIPAIRKVGFKTDRLRNAGWMADFASLHFVGGALKWHSQLPKDVQEDWNKLVQALLNRWPPHEDDDRQYDFCPPKT